MAVVRGVDGCKGGWLAVSRDLETGTVTAGVFETAMALFAKGPVEVTAIDIPIGLPDTGSRLCDREARRLLGPRASSVFPAPARSVLAASSYKDACERSVKATGKKLSKQAYALVPKIREVDLELRGSDALQEAVFEVHPERSFCEWNGGTPMAHPKRSGFGFVERLRLADSVYAGEAQRIRVQVKQSEASDDDILDAIAALWTAERIHRDEARQFPATAPLDAVGLPMRIVA
jgi:predicted RNase H-like nuclease